MKLLQKAVFISFVCFFISTVQAKTLDSIVGIVNEDVITQVELEYEINQTKRRLRSMQASMPSSDVLREQVLEQLINQKLALQYAEQAGIVVDDLELNRALTALASENELTVNQLQQKITQEGESFYEFSEDIRRQMTMGKLQQRQVSQKIKVSEDEITRYLNSPMYDEAADVEYRVGHILISLPGEPTAADIAAATRRAKIIRNRLADGANFETLAIELSKGENALKGGDLGWRRALALPTLFAKEVLALEKGGVAEPIRSASGFHIVKLLDKRGRAVNYEVTETNVRHILIKPDAVTTLAQAKEKIVRLRDEILAGGDFAGLAKDNSQDKMSASKGGDLGWVRPNTMVQAFEAAMKSLKVGELSDPIETEYGWHLVEVLDRRTVDDTANYIKQQAREAIFKRKFEEASLAWQRQLRDEAFVEIL